MADIQEIREAFMRAHRAGDTKNAKILAGLLEKQLAAQSSVPDFLPQQPTAPTKEPETGFFAGLKSGYESLIGDVYAARAYAGEAGAEQKAAKQRELAAQAYRQPEFKEAPVSYVTGLLGQSIPYIAAPLAAAALAPEGAVALGAAGVASALQFTGSNLSRQLAEGRAAKDLQLAPAVGAAIPQAALDVVGFRFVPGLQRIFGAAGKELTEDAAKGILRAYVPQVAKTASVEGITEAGQAILERAQAGLNITDEKAREEYFDNFMGGAILGGTLAVPGTAYERGRAAKTAQEKEAARITEERRVAAEKEEARRATPEYALDVGSRFEALQQQEKELLAARGKKLPKDATDEQKELFEEQTDKLRELRTQLKELAPEYKAIKGKLPALREEQRIAGLTPQQYYYEQMGMKSDEELAQEEAARKEAAAKEAKDPMQEWLERTAAEETRKESEAQALLNKVIEGTIYQNEITGATLTPAQVAEALVKDTSSDMGLVAQVYKGEAKVPGFNKKQTAELRDYLKLQLNELVANRKEALATRGQIESEKEALQRMGEKPLPSGEAGTQLGLTRELEGFAQEMKPGVAAEPGLQKQNYTTKAAEHAEEAADALLKIDENLEKISQGMTLDSSRPDLRKFASATSDVLRQQAEEAKPRYIDAVMNEVANTRAAQNQQPLSADEATKAAVQMNAVLSAYLNGTATNAALRRQLDVIRARMLTYRPEVRKQGLPTEGPLTVQSGYREAQKVAEERGETAQTLEGQLRRQRDYVERLIDQALPLGNMPRDAREALQVVQGAIANNTATREMLDRAEDIASRIVRGQSVRGDVAGLQEATRSMSQAQEEMPGQRDLFGERERGGKGELGFIRASAANFRKFLDSAQVAALRRLLPKVEAAVEKERTIRTGEERPGVDIEFYRKRIDTLEQRITEAKNNLEDIGGASWESIMETRAALPEDVRIARQKLVTLMQEQNKLEMEAAEAKKQKPSGTRPPYAAAQAEIKAQKLKRQIESKEVDILQAMRSLTAQIKEQRGPAIYGPIIQRFEQQAQAFEARLAELKEAMPEGARMSPDFDALFDEVETVQAEITAAREAIAEVRERQEKSEGNAALLAAADDRIVKEKEKLKELQDKLGKVDFVGEERRKAEAEAKAQRAKIAVAEGELAKAKDIARKQTEEFKRRVTTGEGTLKLKRTVVPVERENKKTGEKVLVVEKGTGIPLRQKKTEGAYAQREPFKGLDWKTSKPSTLKPVITPTEEVADEPIAKAQRAGAAENLKDFATVSGTLARQANVTDVKPRPANKKPLRVAQGRDAAARFAKADLKVQAAKEQYGAKSEQYKKALRDAEARYFEKLGEDTGYGADMLPIDQDGTAYRIGESVTNPVDEAQAQAFIDKVKAKLPKGIKFVYAKDLRHAPGKFLVAMAKDGLDVNSDKVKGGVLADGTVVVIGNHHNSMLDLEKTVAHELGHYGTDTLLGKEGMDALYKALDKADGGILGVARQLGVEEDVNEVATEYAKRYEAAKEKGATKAELDAIQKEGQLRALREMLAHVEEARVDKGFLAKANEFVKTMVGAVRAALRKMGFAELPKASTSDIYYVLRNARQGVYSDTLGAYRNPSGEVVLRRGKAAYAAGANPAFAAFNAKTGVAVPEGVNKVFSNVTGLGARTALIDRFAPLKEVASYLKNSAEAMQMMYYARMHDQRMAFTATTATDGARMLAQDEKGNYIIKGAGTPSLKDVSQELAKVKGIGNAAAVRDAFDAYLKAYRAKRVGGEVLNFENPPTPAEIDATIKAGDAIPEFVAARKMYNEYNKGLINWLVQTGAISKELGAQLSSTNDYVPFYRIQGDNVLFEIGDRTPIVIGDVKNQPYLNELVGGKEDTKDFFTAALQNTALLTDMGLRNLATKQTAFTLQSAGLLNGKFNEKTGKTRGIMKGTGPASPDVIRFKIDGVPHYARVDTDAMGVPAEMLVQGMHGTVTQMGGFVKMMSIPARFMRAMITRNPVYSVRQIVRDSTSNYLLTGGNMKPVMSALGELKDMWAGKSEGEKALQERGVLGGQIISGTSEDMQKIMLQLISGKPGWESALAKMDRIAMKADASSRVALYNDFRKQGLSDMEATLAALEAMNFSKRGTSGTLYKLNMMVPFLNAQIQGLNVLWEAFTGKLPYAEALKQRQKFYTRAAMMSAVTLAYAAMMSDDEEYKNATLRDRLQNWFIKVPGVDGMIKVPIPFEVGLIFKALPEAVMLMGQKDEEAREVMKALGSMVAMSSPVGVSTQPQAIKPIIEAALNKSFFTGRDIETAQEQELLPSERVRAGTSELAKLVSSATGGTVSPIMVEHFVNGYSGSMGLAIMQSANALLPTDREAPAKRISEMPVIGGLFQATDAPGQITSMYERAKRYEQIKNTFDKMIAEGRGAEAQALAQKYAREIAFADIAEDFKKDVGEFTTLEKQIRASALSAEEKAERLKEIRKAKIALARAFNVAALAE